MPPRFAKNPQKLWELYSLSKHYNGTRPSEILKMEDPVVAFCFDRAVYRFGQAVEQDITEKTEDSKNQQQARAKASQVFASWMTTDDHIPKGIYRDPMAR